MGSLDVPVPCPTLGVFISGRGSNFQAIHQAILSGSLSAKIGLVLSDRDAAGLSYANTHQIPTVICRPSDYSTREAHDTAMLTQCQDAQADWIVLAGYMRILSAEFLSNYSNRVLNIHPSLLPKFKGLHPQRQALAAGEVESGCTVHYVVPEVDSGPIILQRRVPIKSGDTEAQLGARILEEEHKAYVAALKTVLGEYV